MKTVYYFNDIYLVIMIIDLPLVGMQSEDSGTGDSSGGGTKGSTLFWQWTGRFIACNTLLKKEWIPLLFLHSSVAFFVTRIDKFNNNY